MTVIGRIKSTRPRAIKAVVELRHDLYQAQQEIEELRGVLAIFLGLTTSGQWPGPEEIAMAERTLGCGE